MECGVVCGFRGSEILRFRAYKGLGILRSRGSKPVDKNLNRTPDLGPGSLFFVQGSLRCRSLCPPSWWS